MTRRGVVRIFAGVTILTLTVAGNGSVFGGAVAAHDATPTAFFGPIDPADCTVEPRPAEDILRLPEEIPDPAVDLMLGTPVAAMTPPSGGTAASQEIVDAVTETAIQVVACGNAFDIGRSGALTTDDFFLRAFSGPGADTDPEVLARLIAPHPLPPKNWRSLLSVDEVNVLPDGRVSAIVETDHGTSLTVFAEVDGIYLVDDGYPLPDAESGVARRLFQIVLLVLLGQSPFTVALPEGATPVPK